MLQGLSFVIGITTVCVCDVRADIQVTPHICILWSADMAPSNIRARAMSITLSGLIAGLVQGRLFAGILATYTSWRDTYWFAVAIQAGESPAITQTIELMGSNARSTVVRIT